MIYSLGLARKQILGLGLHEATFAVRGFEENTGAQARLEEVAKTVVYGYNTALEAGNNEEDLTALTNRTKPELQGFLSEGLAMGLFTVGRFSFGGSSSFWKFARQNHGRHEYMSYIGAGLAIGVFGSSFEKFIDKACPMCGHLVLDGIGFYYAMFKTQKGIEEQYVPKKIADNQFYQARYDNGLGRALWFYASGRPKVILREIDKFPQSRRGNIWSGIGLAASYAGGVGEEDIHELAASAKEYSLYLGQGCFLAVHTRYRAENPHLNSKTVDILTGASGESCHTEAIRLRKIFKDKREVDGKPSFQVFLELVRKFIQSKRSAPPIVCYGSIVLERPEEQIL